jgi:hypothetical protein
MSNLLRHGGNDDGGGLFGLADALAQDESGVHGLADLPSHLAPNITHSQPCRHQQHPGVGHSS